MTMLVPLQGSAYTGIRLPNAGCGAKVVNGKLIYQVVDTVDDKQDFRNNLKFEKGRDAEILVEEYWRVVCIFIDRVLDEFYPK